MIDIAFTVLIFIAFAAFAGRRLLTYLHALQQDDYHAGRLIQWILRYKVFDKRLTLALVSVNTAAYFLPEFITHFMIFLSFALAAYMEQDPRTQAKKKLVLTTRAKRILFTALPISLIIALPLSTFSNWFWIFHVQFIPLALVLAVRILKPQEVFLQKKYMAEAKEKLATCTPEIIGITGSFGKTSIKHILGHILKTQGPTLMTPGSVNTPMGITRIIREDLNETHRYFIVEMGAYGPGSIKRLCDLTPPALGIISAVGHAHYERFKTLDTVAQTKFELADAVIDGMGKMIVYDKTLSFDYPKSLLTQTPSTFVVCSEDSKTQADLIVHRIEQTKKGLTIEISWQKIPYVLIVPLYGIHHGINATLAFTAAVTLGIEPEMVLTALKSIPQIRHRLEVIRHADGTTVIDDAFNSNPLGFRSALEVLDTLRDKDGRTILITPGMVELGKTHDQAHHMIGQLAAQHCDIILAVNPKRIPTFMKGVQDIAPDLPLLEMKTFQQASAWLSQNSRPGDVILIENDLPDLYERIPRM